MRDLAFDIRANDRTQTAFDSAGRRANAFGMEMDQTARSISGAVNQTNRLTAATERYAIAGRRAMSANDNWQRRNLMMQMGDVGQMLALGQNPMTTLLQQGPQIAQIYGPGEGGVTRVFKEMGSMVVGAATKFPLLTAAAVAAGIGIAGLTYEINQTTDTAVSFGDVASAVFQVAASAIYEKLRPAIEAIAPWFASAWGWIVSGTKTAVNLFIGAWVVQIDALQTAVGLVPDAFIAAGEAAANGFLSAMEEMAQETVAMFNGLIAKINGLMRSAGLESQIGDLGDPNSIGFGRIDIGGAAARDRLSSGGGDFMDRSSDAMNRDYAGEMFDAVRLQAIANAMSDVEEETGKAGRTAKQAGNGWKSFGQEAARAIEDTLNFAKDLGTGFLSDLRSGLAEGEGIWKSFANAALNALDKIASRILEMATDSLITNLLGSILGGGFLSPKAWGAIQGGGGGLYANGGVFNQGGVTAFANGGIINSPTVFPFAKGIGLMGEAGPEAIMPLQRDSSGRLGVSAAGASAANQNVRVEVEVFVNDDGTIGAIARRAGGEAAQVVVRKGIAAYDATRKKRFEAGGRFG